MAILVHTCPHWSTNTCIVAMEGAVNSSETPPHFHLDSRAIPVQFPPDPLFISRCTTGGNLDRTKPLIPDRRLSSRIPVWPRGPTRPCPAANPFPRLLSSKPEAVGMMGGYAGLCCVVLCCDRSSHVVWFGTNRGQIEIMDMN